MQFSTNAGLNWTEGATPLPKDVAACVRNTNGPIADLAFTPDGTPLYAFAGYPKANDFHSKICVARSTDLGRMFSATAVPSLDPPYHDDLFGTPALPTIAVGPTNAKRVYDTTPLLGGSSSSTSTGTTVAWGLGGAAAALALAGVALFAGRGRLSGGQVAAPSASR